MTVLFPLLYLQPTVPEPGRIISGLWGPGTVARVSILSEPTSVVGVVERGNVVAMCSEITTACLISRSSCRVGTDRSRRLSRLATASAGTAMTQTMTSRNI